MGKGGLTEKLFHGVIPALVTPFTEAGDLDHVAIVKLVEHHIAAGVNGLYVCGSTGEGMSMTVSERKEMLSVTCAAAAGRIPVMVMVGACPLEDALELTRHADTSGAAAISTVAPGAYSWIEADAPDLKGCVHFFNAVASASTLPFYPYWLGTLAGGVSARSFLMAMRDVPRFAGLKYTPRDLYIFQQLIDLAPSILGRRLNMLSGPDECHIAACAMGADGAIGSTYNLMPQLFLKMRAAFESGAHTEALALQARANRVIDALLTHTRCDVRGTHIVAGIKAAMRELQQVEAAGFGRAATRSDTCPWTAKEEMALLSDLRALDFAIA